MIVECTNCLAKFKFDEAKLKGVSHKNVRCSKCNQIFAVMAPGEQQQVKQASTADVVPTPSHIPTNNMPAMKGNISDNTRKVSAANALGSSLGKKPIKANKKSTKPGLSINNSGTLKPDFSPMEDLDNDTINQFTMPDTIPGGVPDLMPDTVPDTVPDLKFDAIPDTFMNEPNSPVPAPPESTFEASNLPVDKTETDEPDSPATSNKAVLPKILPDVDSNELIPDESTQKKINEEYYKTDEITLERSPELNVLKEILFGDDSHGLGVAIIDRGKNRKKKQVFIPRELSGERIGNAYNRSSFAMKMTMFIKIVLILMMLAVAFVSYNMIADGEKFNYAQLGTIDFIDNISPKIEDSQN